ncbi:MAG: AbrB/MazE/SpoVT family DNA-binding domain-containing protein [Candidatus Binataceae bacterium]
MASTKITSRGRVTIPLEVRRHLKVKPGDRLAFRIEPERQSRS